MADRPILFSAPMVRAILREIAATGTGKTQTRRLLNVDPAWHLDPRRRAAAEAGHYWFTDHLDEPGCYHVEPRYWVGDRLWVREAHALVPRLAYRMSIGTGTIAQQEHPTDGYSAALFREGFDRSGRPKWRPSIHMPRWASRLTLHVTDVRVQRLQEISEADAVAEGIERMRSGRGFYDVEASHGAVRAGVWHYTATDSFSSLWDSLNAERAPWAGNPWVVAVTFRPVLGNIDSEAA